MDYLTLVNIVFSLISVGGAVFSMLFIRRGADNAVKADVEELSLLVERLAKTQRRDRMQRVRNGAGDADPSGQIPAPLEGPVDIKAHKAALRRRLINGGRL